MITDEAKYIKAKIYADHVRQIVQRKHAIEIQIDHERNELGLSSVALGDKVQTSPSADAIPDAVARLIELVSEYTEHLAEYVDEIETFGRAISKIDPQYHTALYLRYVLMKDWQTIADKVNYSKSRLYEIRHDALIALYPVMPEIWRSQAIPDATP